MPLLKTMHKFASPFFYQAGLYQKLWQARNSKEPFSFVVIYHRVVADNLDRNDSFDIERGISASDFEKQMLFLLENFTPVRASEVQSSLSNRIGFAVTLDDGYEDNYLVAAPILKRLGIPATFYVVSDFVGTDRLFWWEQVADIMHKSTLPELDMSAILDNSQQPDEDLQVLPLRNPRERDHAYGQLCTHIRNGLHRDIPMKMNRVAQYFDIQLREQGRHYGLMNWQQLSDLAGQGFDIGGHTATHCNVVGADEALLQRELVESVHVIEARLGTAVESFAYPYGIFDASEKTIVDLLTSTNCKAAFTSEQGVVNTAIPATLLPRTTLNRAYHFACAFNVQDTLNKGLITD